MVIIIHCELIEGLLQAWRIKSIRINPYFKMRIVLEIY